tara:strand:+ start:1100 stop:1600 length:501 start_codon:yes stop_codon:yes gene_type:complete
MGFDLSGVNPKINKNISEYKHYDPDTKIWNSKDEKLRKKYFDDMDRYHNDNPGVYFRNNVWWWRPLWDFVCLQCDEFMTDEQKMGGSYNDGKLIDQETAAKIGTKLEILLADGTVDRWEEHIKKRNKELEKSDDKEKRFMASYPFARDNVENFAKFCLESGGFEIC